MTDDQFAILKPLVHRSIRHLIIIAMIINTVLITLALSNIYSYAKYATWVLVLIMFIISHWKFTKIKAALSKVLSLSGQACTVTFSMQSLGEGYFAHSKIKLDDKIYNQSCALQNFDSQVMGIEIKALVYIDDQKPLWVISEDQKYFAILD